MNTLLSFFCHCLFERVVSKKEYNMSFLHLKKKSEPKYYEPKTTTIHKDIFAAKTKPEE